MTGFLPDYEVHTPPTLEAALACLSEQPGHWTPLAGGTDVMVLMDAALLRGKNLLNIRGLDALHGISATADAVRLGALTTFMEVQRHPLLQAEFPLLCAAARESGAVAIQIRGTLGGNIANGSPAADSPPALLVYQADLELVSSRGMRTVRYTAFHRGYKQMDLAPDELVYAIVLPRRGPKEALHYYRKVGTRRAQAISKVAIAAMGELDATGRVALCRVGFASVAPTPVRCSHVESTVQGRPLNAALIEAAALALAQDIAPIDDIRSTRDYRLTVSRNLLAEFLRRLGASR